jgi:hypothetical protein
LLSLIAIGYALCVLAHTWARVGPPLLDRLAVRIQDAVMTKSTGQTIKRRDSNDRGRLFTGQGTGLRGEEDWGANMKFQVGRFPLRNVAG